MSNEDPINDEEEVLPDPSLGLSVLENNFRKMEIAEFELNMLKRLKVDHGLLSVTLANAPYDYYSWTLE